MRVPDFALFRRVSVSPLFTLHLALGETVTVLSLHGQASLRVRRAPGGEMELFGDQNLKVTLAERSDLSWIGAFIGDE